MLIGLLIIIMMLYANQFILRLHTQKIGKELRIVFLQTSPETKTCAMAVLTKFFPRSLLTEAFLFRSEKKEVLQILNGMNSSAMVEPSNTLVLVDASYYNVLPRYVGRLDGAPAGGLDVCSSSYPKYWKNLGNSYLFKWNGTAEVEPSDAEALKLIDARYSGMLNVIKADTSAKSYKTTFLLNEFGDKGAESMWNPYKSTVTPCP